jgi:hypothetical protein
MNKFSGPDDSNFMLVRDSIKNFVREASGVLKRRRTGKPTYLDHIDIDIEFTSSQLILA